MMKNLFFMKRMFSLSLLAAGMATASMAQVTLNIDAGQRGALIGDRHYGIFFEEINHAGDGGLYAELIHNRLFEDSAPNPDNWWPVGGHACRSTPKACSTRRKATPSGWK